MNIAVLGLGAMGLPMATWLTQSFTVTGFDIADERVQLAAEQGVTCRASAREACADADVALVAVRNQAQLEELLYGGAGIVEMLPKGSAIILTSTVGIAAVEQVAQRLLREGHGDRDGRRQVGGHGRSRRGRSRATLPARLRERSGCA